MYVFKMTNAFKFFESRIKNLSTPESTITAIAQSIQCQYNTFANIVIYQ